MDDDAADRRLPQNQTPKSAGAPLPSPVRIVGGIDQPAWCRAEVVSAASIENLEPDEENHAVPAPISLPVVMRVTGPSLQPSFHTAPVAALDGGAGASEPELAAARDAVQADATPRDGPGLLRRAASKAVKLVAMIAGLWVVGVLGLIGVFRSVDPPGSALMSLRALSGVSVQQSWVDLDKISPHLVRAVVVSEDGRFCQHWGIDLKEVEAAIKRANGKTPRGASTISMQVAKNLFLWPDQSYVRKALEVPITLAIESWWSKRRILEVYLNIAEWGPGIFGAESAARAHFNTTAARLDVRQAALLAASLPNPIRRRAGNPGRTTLRLAQRLQMRIRRARGAAACVLKPVQKARAHRNAKD